MLQEPGQSVCLKLLYYFYIIKDYNKIGEIVFLFSVQIQFTRSEDVWVWIQKRQEQNYLSFEFHCYSFNRLNIDTIIEILKYMDFVFRAHFR